MDLDETVENNDADSRTSPDSNQNFNIGVCSPVASSSRHDLFEEESMSLFDEPLSPGAEPEMLNLCTRNIRQTPRLNCSHHSTNLPGPSSSLEVPGPSTSTFSGYGIVDISNDTEAQQIRHLFSNDESARLFDEQSTEMLTPNSRAARNTDSASSIHVLCESPGAGNEENNFRTNTLGHLDIDSVSSRSNYDSSNAEQFDSANQLFAPEDSSNGSIENSPVDMSSSFQGPFSYLKYLTDRQDSIDEHSLLRRYPRYNRFFRPPLSLSDVRDSEIPLRLGTTQRLSSSLLHRSRILNSRLRMRYAHADLFPRHKTTAALNAATSNDDDSTLRNGSELRDLNARPYRRNFCLPKFNNELRYPPHITSLECNGNRYHRVARPDRSVNHRPSAFLQSLYEIENSLRRFSRPPISNVRARSVSPISANPDVSGSIHDEPLDDIDIPIQTRFSSENLENQIPRPVSPLPPILSPTLSDEGIAVVSRRMNNVDRVEILTPPVSAERKGDLCRSAKSTINASDKFDAKEAPQTYEELNNELIQLLECPICFEYTTPPISQCLQGHIICHTCRQRVSCCPTCRTIFQESRNLIMEKVAALLRYPCKNAVTGCREFLYLLQKEQHEMACGFRQYACFLPLCNWRGYKPELLVHVQETHENHVIHGCSTNLLIPVSGQMKKVWLMSAFNELFYVIFFTTMGILKGCVSYIGDDSKCDNFAYNISVTSEEDMLRNFNYTRRTHAYEESFENIDMFDSYDLFSISHAQLNLFRKGTKAPIRITIEETAKRGLTSVVSSNGS